MERLSIGILACNEAGGIGDTLHRLKEQTVFDRDRHAGLGLAGVEIVVVPNGCTDETAGVASAALALFPDSVRTSVRPIGMAGKSNAWNAFVHDFSAPEATVMALMDADVTLATSDVLEQLLARLASDRNAQATTAIPTRNRPPAERGPLAWLSRRASKQREGGSGLSGQLYLARAATLRRIWLPQSLPVEDGFITAMLKTDGFTRPPHDEVIASVANARHCYDAPKGIGGFIRHEARIIVGSTVNAWLFTVLWREGRNGHVGRYIGGRNREDPDWVERVCDEERATLGRVLVPRTFLT